MLAPLTQNGCLDQLDIKGSFLTVRDAQNIMLFVIAQHSVNCVMSVVSKVTSKLRHCVKAAHDNINNQGEDHIIDEDVETAEPPKPHNEMCITLTFRNHLKMLLTFLIRVWYNSAIQHSWRIHLKMCIWHLVLIVIGL